MAYATLDDVEARLGRPLTSAEQTKVEAYLDDVSALMDARVPSLAARLAEGDIAESLPRMVAASAVLRVVNNPQGVRQRSVDDYQETFDARAASGFLYLLEDEVELLTAPPATSGAFTITPYYEPDDDSDDES